MFQAIGKGEAAISMAVLDNVIDNRDNNKMPLEIIDANKGAITITDCIAATKMRHTQMRRQNLSSLWEAKREKSWWQIHSTVCRL